MGEQFDPHEFERRLSSVEWVREVHALDEIDSTNSEALRLAAGGSPGGTVVVADRQTSGRGRLGRTWWSRPGASVCASVLLRPRMASQDWPLLTIGAGVAAADAIAEESGIRVALKWPNDVLASGRKIGGILAEAQPPGAVVIGFGVNVSCQVPADLEETATSIADAGGTAPSRSELVAAILDRLGEFIGAPARALPRYRLLCSTIGREVSVARSGADPVAGTAADVDDGGALVVSTAVGAIRIVAGDVVHLRDAQRPD
jgi:BirA family biotin operon repressor/biotin-[acetyl-CoA-carboxylase] ligase